MHNEIFAVIKPFLVLAQLCTPGHCDEKFLIGHYASNPECIRGMAADKAEFYQDYVVFKNRERKQAGEPPLTLKVECVYHKNVQP